MQYSYYFQGLPPVFPIRSDQDEVNFWTHKTGVYSNWDLMSTVMPLQGDPLHNVVPGSDTSLIPGYQGHPHYFGQGDVQLSRWFLGLDVQRQKSSLINAGNPIQNDFYGRYVNTLFRGVTGAKVFSANYGHLAGKGPMQAYAEWSNYIYYGVAEEQALETSTLGHPVRYIATQSASELGPDNSNPGPAATFGSFNPYLYKGVTNSVSNPMNDIFHPGHPVWPSSVEADQMPEDYGQIPPPRQWPEHYGFEHVLEWHGVPSAKAL